MVNGVAATEEEFYSLVARIKPVIDEVEAGLRRGRGPDAVRGPDRGRLRVLQGARGATSPWSRRGWAAVTTPPASSARTCRWSPRIGREHAEILGETPLAILEEKAAVIPAGGKVMAGHLERDVHDRLAAICAERGAVAALPRRGRLAAPRQRTGELRRVRGPRPLREPATLACWDTTSGPMRPSPSGRWSSSSMGRRTSSGCARRSRSPQIPGRLEVISQKPLCILDGAHNPHGMAEMVRSLDHLLNRRRLIAVVSILRDKDALEMLEDLAPRCDILFATQNSNPRSYPADELAALLEGIDARPRGLRRQRPSLGAAERLPSGQLEPGRARDRVALPDRGHEAEPGWLSGAGTRPRSCCSQPSCCWRSSCYSSLLATSWGSPCSRSP